MKKHRLPLLLMLTAVFFTFTLGFFLGRNHKSQTMSVSTMARHDAAPETAAPLEDAEVSFPIDINSADLYTLTALPGIGDTLARRIIQHRELHGPFPQTEELLNVEGLGSGKLELILDYVTTGG